MSQASLLGRLSRLSRLSRESRESASAPSDPAVGGSGWPLSARCATAALAGYVVVGLTLAVPPPTPWALVVPAGAVLLGAGLRTGRAAFVGSALALAAGVRVGRAAFADDSGPGGGLGLFVLALALAAVGELARLAVDAGARRGPVRIAPEVRHRLRVDAVLLAGLATAATATAVALAAPRWSRPPGVLLPLGVLALPALLAALTWLARSVGARPPLRPQLDPGERHAGPPRSRSPSRRPELIRPDRSRRVGPIALVVVVAAIGVPLLAGLGAQAPGPFGGGPSPADDAAVEDSPTSASDAVLAPLDRRTDDSDREPPSPPLGLVIAAGVLALALALLLGGGEGLVSADDRRPDTAPVDEPLRGAPAAPVVQALPPEVVAAVVDDALRYLRAELEPRLAVRCAYAAVAAGLGRHELARLPAETEMEFLARQLHRSRIDPAHPSPSPPGPGAATDGPSHPGPGVGTTGPSPTGPGVGTTGPSPTGPGTAARSLDALARLTDLFELARFSERPIDAGMRAEALAALEDVRRDLDHLLAPPPSALPRPSTGRPHTAPRPPDPGPRTSERP